MAKKDARSPEHDRPNWRDRMQGLRQKNLQEMNMTSQQLRDRAEGEVMWMNHKYKEPKARAERQALSEINEERGRSAAAHQAMLDARYPKQ
jgi:hypothetical protein